MPFLNKQTVIDIVSSAILNRDILSIRYQRIDKNKDVVMRRKAPFDIGTTNAEKIESNKNNLYAYSYDHVDEKTGEVKPMFNAINIEHIISMEPTGEKFDENELADIQKAKTGYDYRTCRFALVPHRNWF